MADISVTAENVIKGSGATIQHVTAGETITAGQVVYLDSTDNEYKKADNTTATLATAIGIALNGASDGQPLTILTKGDLNPGGTVVVGEVYCVSGSGGGIAPDLDIVSADFRTVLGIGETASNIIVNIQIGGIALP